MSCPGPVPDMRRDIAARPLSSSEWQVLGALLDLDFPGVGELRCQMQSVRVVGQCTCGCATVDLQADSTLCASAGTTSPIPAEAVVLDSEGAAIWGLLVFLREGYLASLEIYSFDQPIDALPPPERIRTQLNFR